MKSLVISISIFAVFSLSGCQKEEDFFPLQPGLSWLYQVKITPEVEPPELKKMVISNLPSIDLISPETHQKDLPNTRVTPRLREDNSLYYYQETRDGLYRIAYQPRPGIPVDFETPPRYVFKYPLKEGTNWTAPSETYLLVRRYPLDHDYRVTVDFDLNYRIESTQDSVQVPAGLFKNCLRIHGEGETIFIGDRGLGRVRLKVSSTEWFAPNIGLIKSQRVEETSTDLFGTSELLIELESLDR